MNDTLYAIDSRLIALLLLALLVVAVEGGNRLGIIASRRAVGPLREHVHAIQASLLGVLALLLGFTFSLALERHDSRSEAVIDEANAIGTTWLRVELLRESLRPEVRATLARYVDLRIRESRVTLANAAEHQAVMRDTAEVQALLWGQAARAVAEDPRPTTSGLYAQALNAAIDASGKREGELARHVPATVLLLLFLTFITTVGTVGYACGISGHRPSVVTWAMVLLVVVLVFLIVDLDRPRRGFIEVNRESLHRLGETTGVALPAPRGSGG